MQPIQYQRRLQQLTAKQERFLEIRPVIAGQIPDRREQSFAGYWRWLWELPTCVSRLVVGNCAEGCSPKQLVEGEKKRAYQFEFRNVVRPCKSEQPYIRCL